MAWQKPDRMAGVVLVGHGGFDKLVFREDLPLPEAGPNDVLIEIGAAGVNNTDINTRTAWYSKTVREGTESGGESGWSGEPIAFPRIQGADGCGRIVAVGEAVSPARIGERVLVRTMINRPGEEAEFDCWTLGSECDGAFAQYLAVPAVEAFSIDCDWSDAELASIPCAYSTAENLLHRAALGEGERVLITGASGGVGSAAIQLAKRRGAEIVAVSGATKAAEVQALGASQVVDRDADLVEALGRDSVDVVVDLVAGPSWPSLLEVLRRGGRYATAGAIAGPLVELDVRTLYLKDLTFFGCTYQPRVVFENLVGYIERGEIAPLVARTYPLKDIVEAQEDFLAKRYVGKLVLLPPERAE